MTHCPCDDCKRDRELLESMRELLPLLLFMARAQVQTGTTIANKWKELDGEIAFREMADRKKRDIIPSVTV